MWMRIRLADLRVMSHYVGLFVAGIGFVMLIPLGTAVVFGEWDVALDFLVGVGVAFTVGGALALTYSHNERVTHANALVLTALGWLAAAAAAAIPFALSPNYPTFIDAMFDTVSGLTTSGLTVAVDLDHMSYAMNMWRHLTHLIGGQGIIVAALSLSIGLRGGAFSLYVAEGRDERILPNVLHTARFIWFVTAVYVTLGTATLSIANIWRGMDVARGLLHAFWLSIAAYDTGGFAPQSMNAMYYHSFLLEILTLFLMIAGTMNFNLHAQVWRGDTRELWKNLEVRVLAINALVLSAIVAVGLAATSLFGDAVPALRKGVFHIVSAHTGTGHQTIYAAQWIRDLGGTSFAAVLLAMAAGGAVSSTAGGIKALRLGVIIKAV
ncbi:MAG: TrkH family potassium uptake protein, partial [Coriobacteriia bacterium]|nr:TrkH family potassium uptake protein [Coriobacteriia bacterium]